MKALSAGTGDYVLNIGGVCGYNYGGTIKSCYNTVFCKRNR